MLKEKKMEIPPRKTLKEILDKLGVGNDKTEKLTPQLLEATFLDTFTKYDEGSDSIRLIGSNVVTGEENYIIINLLDSTLEYHEITNGINRIRKYTSSGFDLSLINQL